MCIRDRVVGVQRPEDVNAEHLKTLFSYGKIFVHVTKGGLDVPREGGGGPTVIANVALKVSLEDVE